MSLEQRFREAADKVQTFTKKPADNELLDLYGLFKQATVGDVNTSKPGLLDIKAKYKWETWEKRKGLSKEESMEKYIALVDELTSKYA